MDINDAKPIDTFTLNTYSIFTVTLESIPIVFRINKSKIDYVKFSSMTNSEQRKEKITLEKVTDLNLYKKSKFKEGFEDFEIDLSKSITFGPKLVND
jgi:hypothetical protein